MRNAAGAKKYGYSWKPERAFAVAIWLNILPPSGIRYNEYFLPDEVGHPKGVELSVEALMAARG
eukprot:1469258-Prorocentrum_lima.AAC.1